jgi:hypothetical protein
MSTPLVDEIGVVSKIRKNLMRAQLIDVVVDQIGNRRHGDVSKGFKILIARFEYKGTLYFLQAHNQYINKDAVKKIHTLYNRRETEETDELKLGYHGIGSQLIYYLIEGEILFAVREGIADIGNMTFICEQLDAKNYEDLKIGVKDYRFTPPNRKEKLIIEDDDFRKTPLGEFIRSMDFETFIISKAPNSQRNPEFTSQEAWNSFSEELAKTYTINFETEDLQIYTAYNLDIANLSPLKPAPHLCLIPKYWIHSYTVEWNLVDNAHKNDPTFWNSIGRWVHPCNYGKKIPDTKEYWMNPVNYQKKENEADLTKDFWFHLERNATREGTSINTRYIQIKIPTKWTPYMRTTIGRLKDEYIPKIGAKEENGSKGYIIVQGDYVNSINIDDGNIRNLKGGYNYRIIIELLHTKLNTLKGSGYEPCEIKRISTIRQKGSIDQCILETIKLGKKWFDHLGDSRISKPLVIDEDLDLPVLTKIHNSQYRDEDHRQKSIKRSEEGEEFEQRILDACKDKIPNGLWECGDKAISARHGLEGAGIDGLYICKQNNISYGLLMQIKAKNECSHDEIDKFKITCRSFERKYPEMKVRRLLILRQVATQKRETINEWTKKGIACLGYSENTAVDTIIRDIVTYLMDFVQ